MTVAFRSLRLFAALAWLALIVSPFVAQAHRLDEYLQATLVAIDPGGVRLQINLTPGVEVAERVLGLSDLDGDGAISPQEASAYGHLLQRDLRLALDGSPLALKLSRSSFSELDELRSGTGIIQMEYTASPGALTAGSHTLRVDNWHLLGQSVYLVNATRPESDSIQIDAQKRTANQSTASIEFTYHPPAVTSPVARAMGIPLTVSLALAVLIIVRCLWKVAHRRERQMVEPDAP